MKKNFLIAIIILFTNPLLAQVMEDKVIDKDIQTVLLFNSKSIQSFPIITLNSNETFTLLFDDIAHEFQNLNYSIVHCTANWEPSKITQLEYMIGFSENYITEYRFSSIAKRNYTHYSLTFPNNDVKLLLSGNYCISVFQNGNPENPLFVKRFMVLDSKVAINTLVDRSSVINDRNKKQKIDFTILYSGLRVDNPLEQFNILVMQNNRWDNAKLNTKPTFVSPGKLEFSHVDANLFDGLNEYRRMDIRSVRFLGEHVSQISLDTGNHLFLLTDFSRYSDRYANEIDMNGDFSIQSNDNRRASFEADYVHVHFRFDYGSQNKFGDYYVLGRFNNWQATEQYKMKYNPTYRIYEADILLKQGLYNYMYGFKAKNANLTDIASVEGSFFDTENNYRILVYYRKLGNRYDELIGLNEFNTLR